MFEESFRQQGDDDQLSRNLTRAQRDAKRLLQHQEKVKSTESGSKKPGNEGTESGRSFNPNVRLTPQKGGGPPTTGPGFDLKIVRMSSKNSTSARNATFNPDAAIPEEDENMDMGDGGTWANRAGGLTNEDEAKMRENQTISSVRGYRLVLFFKQENEGKMTYKPLSEKDGANV